MALLVFLRQFVTPVTVRKGLCCNHLQRQLQSHSIALDGSTSSIIEEQAQVA